jgi:hypothetical protein
MNLMVIDRGARCASRRFCRVLHYYLSCGLAVAGFVVSETARQNGENRSTDSTAVVSISADDIGLVGLTVDYELDFQNHDPIIVEVNHGNITSPRTTSKRFWTVLSGGFLWMQLVKMEGVQYFGADITPITAEKNNECFKSDARHFHVIDWSCKIPPPVDLILLRDVLFHLSTSVNLDILRHINQSGSKYLLTTTFGQF